MDIWDKYREQNNMIINLICTYCFTDNIAHLFYHTILYLSCSNLLDWPELWRLEPFRISFLLCSVYDALPTPANLHRWGMREDPLCRLGGERGTMAHIPAGCKTALSQGTYRWRHNRVLGALTDILEQERCKKFM